MKKSVEINDDIIKRYKKYEEEHQTTFTSIVNTCLSDWLRERGF